jgi:hypothetical protein
MGQQNAGGETQPGEGLAAGDVHAGGRSGATFHSNSRVLPVHGREAKIDYGCSTADLSAHRKEPTGGKGAQDHRANGSEYEDMTRKRPTISDARPFHFAEAAD